MQLQNNALYKSLNRTQTLEYTNYPKRGPRRSEMNSTDDSGEEIKYFSKTKIDQNKHLETVKLLQCLLANSLQRCLGMQQNLSFSPGQNLCMYLFLRSGETRLLSGGFPHDKNSTGNSWFWGVFPTRVLRLQERFQLPHVNSESFPCV